MRLPSECTKLYQLYDSSVCWTKTDPILMPHEYRKCQQKCKRIEFNETKCCSWDCPYEVSGIFVNNKFDGEMFLRAFERSFEDESQENEKSLWLPVIAKSIKFCEKTG